MEASLDDLKVLKSRSRKAKRILKDPSYNLVRALSEICYNINLGNTKLSKAKQKKYTKLINKLGSTSITLGDKRTIISKTKPAAVRDIIDSVKWLNEWLSSRRRTSSSRAPKKKKNPRGKS